MPSSPVADTRAASCTAGTVVRIVTTVDSRAGVGCFVVNYRELATFQGQVIKSNLADTGLAILGGLLFLQTTPGQIIRKNP